MEAGTLADLHALIEDLQNETKLAPVSDAIELKHPLTTARSSKIGFFSVAVPLVAGLVALTFGIRSCSAPDDSAALKSGYQNPAIVADVAAALKAKTGTTVVDSMGLYDGYVVIWMPAPNAPQKQVNYTYRDGVLGDFDDDFTNTRDADEPQIDITTVDRGKAAGIVAGAAQSLNLSRIDSYNIRFSGTDNGPEVSLSAENTDKESGTLSFDPDGNFVRVSPFSFG